MSGDRPVDWVYVDDVVEGLLASAQAQNVDGKQSKSWSHLSAPG